MTDAPANRRTPLAPADAPPRISGGPDDVARGRRAGLPIWFFIGVLLLVYGLIILAAGIVQFSRPPATVLAQLHATFWAGIVLTLIGTLYTLAYRPR